MNKESPNIVSLRDDGAISARETRMRQLLAEHGSPLFVIDAHLIRQQYRQLIAALPGVEHYYAVKALPNPDVVSMLVAEGAGLDLASSGEVELARMAECSPRKTIHTHPIKKHPEIRAALRFGTTTFVIDNAAELEKFKAYRHRVGLLIRLRFQSPDAVVDLSSKFGCDAAEALALLKQAQDLGIRIKGFSFHVGSQSGSPQTHVRAIQESHRLIAEADREGFDHLNLLDIGGGFPVDYQQTAMDIESFCAPIRAALRELPAHIRVIAEPGRYLVAPAAQVIATVVGKAQRDGRPWYYLDDGVYGSWSGQMYDHAHYPVTVFREGERQSSVLAGPTCDSIDVIDANINLPQLQLGDLVVGLQMGAYTAASATDFNALPRAKAVVINGEEKGDAVAVDF